MFEAVEHMFAANSSTHYTPEDERRLSPGPEDGGHITKKQMSTHPTADDGTRSVSSSVGSVQPWCSLPTVSESKEAKEGGRTVEDLRPRQAITIGGAATVADAARAMASSKEDARPPRGSNVAEPGGPRLRMRSAQRTRVRLRRNSSAACVRIPQVSNICMA